MLKTLATLLLVSGAISVATLDTVYAKAAVSAPQISKMIKSLQGKSQSARYIQELPSLTIPQLGTICNELAGDMVAEAEGTWRCDVDEDTFLECNNRGDCVIVGGPK